MLLNYANSHETAGTIQPMQYNTMEWGSNSSSYFWKPWKRDNMQIIPRDQYVNRGLPMGQEKKKNKQAVSRPVSFDNQFSVIIKSAMNGTQWERGWFVLKGTVAF